MEMGSIHGGSQYNIISNQVKMQLTLRSYSTDVRNHTIAAIKRMTENIGRAAGLAEDLLPQVVILDEHTPAAYNEPKLTANMVALFESLIGEKIVIELGPEMVGEAFGFQPCILQTLIQTLNQRF